jgi:TAZ zinc finger
MTCKTASHLVPQALTAHLQQPQLTPLHHGTEPDLHCHAHTTVLLDVSPTLPSPLRLGKSTKGLIKLAAANRSMCPPVRMPAAPVSKPTSTDAAGGGNNSNSDSGSLTAVTAVASVGTANSAPASTAGASAMAVHAQHRSSATSSIDDIMDRAKKAAQHIWLLQHAAVCDGANCELKTCPPAKLLLQHMACCCSVRCKPACMQARKLLHHYSSCTATNGAATTAASANAKSSSSISGSAGSKGKGRLCLVCSLVARNHEQHKAGTSVEVTATTVDGSSGSIISNGNINKQAKRKVSEHLASHKSSQASLYYAAAVEQSI